MDETIRKEWEQETIRKEWERSFKHLLEDIDSERTKEDIAAMFFELGWKAGVENEHKTISSAIKYLKTLKHTNHGNE